jgi:hypothetical protein
LSMTCRREVSAGLNTPWLNECINDIRFPFQILW